MKCWDDIDDVGCKTEPKIEKNFQNKLTYENN